jgi:hypothetical protein
MVLLIRITTGEECKFGEDEDDFGFGNSKFETAYYFCMEIIIKMKIIRMR